jgi:putative transposase
MRYTRRSVIPDSGAVVHKIWRFHNREFGLKSEDLRKLFLRCTLAALGHRSVGGKIKIQAFCIMSNHSHQLIHSTAECRWLSKFMQVALTKFGRIYNDLLGRSGAVGNGRPKTIPIQETDSALMRTHMYIEANPIRARFRTFENLKLYQFSSFRFYAHGITDEFTKNLEPPAWYLKLGSTPLARQRTYRSHFKKYIDHSRGNASDIYPKMGIHQFFGELNWVYEQLRELRKSITLGEIRPPPVLETSSPI